MPLNPAHHLERSQLYLGFASDDLRAGDLRRAARAVERAASHAATAAAVHWHHRHYSWRRLTSAVASLVHAGRVEYRHLRTLREMARLTTNISDDGNDPNAVRALLRRLCRRVARLRHAVVQAMSHDPHPVSIADFLASAASGNQAHRPESASPAPGIQPQSPVPHQPTSQTALAPATQALPKSSWQPRTIKSSFLRKQESIAATGNESVKSCASCPSM